MGLLPGQVAQTSCRLGVLRLDAGRLNAFPAPLPTGLDVRVTQVAAEVFTTAPAATRVTQTVAEVFVTTAAPTRVTQVALEVFLPQPIPARVTQVAAELYRAHPAAVRVSQAIVELFVLLPPEGGNPQLPCFPTPPTTTAGGSCPPSFFDPDSGSGWEN